MSEEYDELADCLSQKDETQREEFLAIHCRGLKSGRDSLERIVRVLVDGMTVFSPDGYDDEFLSEMGMVRRVSSRFTPGDWAFLRSLITPEGGQ